MNDTTASGGGNDTLHDIYEQLRKGLGHDRVNDDNVDELIRMAEQRGDQQLRELLREWSAPCGNDDEAARPSTIAPTPGFNRENARR